jgi:hypothetical protein
MCHPYSGSGCSNKHLNSLLFTYIKKKLEIEIPNGMGKGMP